MNTLDCTSKRQSGHNDFANSTYSSVKPSITESEVDAGLRAVEGNVRMRVDLVSVYLTAELETVYAQDSNASLTSQMISACTSAVVSTPIVRSYNVRLSMPYFDGVDEMILVNPCDTSDGPTPPRGWPRGSCGIWVVERIAVEELVCGLYPLVVIWTFIIREPMLIRNPTRDSAIREGKFAGFYGNGSGLLSLTQIANRIVSRRRQ